MAVLLDAKSRALIDGLHPDLKRVIIRAFSISDIPLRVTEGLRTLARQKELKAKGMSKTLNSRHLTGHAVDLVPNYDVDGDGRIDAQDLYSWPAIRKVMAIMKQAAKLEGVPLEAGGDWKKFPDGPHYQLPWKQYPATSVGVGLLGGQNYRADPSEDLSEAFADVRYDQSDLLKPLAKSKSFLSGLGAGGLTLGYVTDTLIGAKDQVDTAKAYAGDGSYLGLIIGGLILSGIVVMLYEKWDTAGRPLPWRKAEDA